MSKPIRKFNPKVKKAFNTVFNLNELTFIMKELDYGVDIASNTVFFNDEVSSDSLYETMSRFNLLLKCNGMHRHIIMNVSSFGGDVYSMYGIHDCMRNFAIPIDTICIGPAMSAAAFLLTSGTGTRRVTENSSVMFHQMDSVVEGSTSKIGKNVDHIKFLQKRMTELLGKYSKKPQSFWESHIKEGDFFLNANECLEYGVVDEVIKMVK